MASLPSPRRLRPLPFRSATGARPRRPGCSAIGTCFDLSSYTVTIYSGATSVFWSGSYDYSQVACTATSNDYWPNSAWSTATFQTTVVSSGCLNGFPNFSTNEGCRLDANPAVINRLYFCSAAGHDFMEWFSNISSHEFMVVQ